MLNQFKSTKRGTLGEYVIENYKNTGYTIVTIGTEFAGQGDYDPATDQFWFSGVGFWQVDYPVTSYTFWHLMQKYEPIAVMTTSRFKWTNQWMLEIGAKNLARSGWSLLSWNEDRPPYIGGSDIDPAKLWGPNAGHGPRADNPPDATRAADPVADNKVGREITDAVYDIQTEILARLTGEFAQADLKAEANTKFQGVDDKDRYVSAFAGYHAL